MKLDFHTLSTVRHELATQDKVRVPLPEGTQFAGINVTHMEFNLSYDKGGDYLRRRRGFYLSVQPVELGGGFVRMIPTQGVRGFVSPEPIARVSKAARKAAWDNVTVSQLEWYLEQVG